MSDGKALTVVPYTDVILEVVYARHRTAGELRQWFTPPARQPRMRLTSGSCSSIGATATPAKSATCGRWWSDRTVNHPSCGGVQQTPRKDQQR